MTASLSRRAVILAAAMWPFTTARATAASASLAALEAASSGRLGVAALNTADGSRLLHRADERFPTCSTFKVLVAAAILERSARDDRLLERRIEYRRSDLVAYSPITQDHVGDGLRVGELCAAAIRYSDNTAGNLLMKLLGGPAAITAYARSFGDGESRFDRWETELNTAIPGDPRDTSTPTAMAANLQRLALGDALPPAQRERLVDWLRGNTTGATRIRAGLPADWSIGDKTGTGDYGSTNDIAVAWPEGRSPIVIAIYFTQAIRDAKPRNDVLAAAARIVAQAFART